MSNFYPIESKEIKHGFFSRYLKAINKAFIKPVITFAIDYSFPEIIALLLVTAIVISVGAFMAHMFLTL